MEANTSRLQRINEKYPQCLQTGKFIVNFLIEHPKDTTKSFENKRYWTEYHESSSFKQLGTKYHLIQPSETSQIIAKQQNLVPYREWINLSDPSILIHGPFNFATLNNRKTRDRVSTTNWEILRSSSKLYDDSPPHLSKLIQSNVYWNQPIQLQQSSTEVNTRTSQFLQNLNQDINDDLHTMFGDIR